MDAVSACGWPEASRIAQQDASEAFSFITEKLGLPLLSLKMDIYHVGKENSADDHKIVNERLLEVAIPETPDDGSEITLERCLEDYFNTRIEVRRHLDRRSTIRSQTGGEKASDVRLETREMPSSPSSPVHEPDTLLPPTISRLHSRQRADSIFSERYVGANNDSY